MEFLILAHLDDSTALAVGAMLRKRWGRESVGVVSAPALVMAQRWKLTWRGSSNAPFPGGQDFSSSVQLAGGLVLEDDKIRVIFNRLRIAEAPHFANASPADSEFAQAEIGALLVSWLASLSAKGAAVINPILRGNLQPGYSRVEWLKMAAQAGMSFQPASLSSGRGDEFICPEITHRALSAGETLLSLDPPAAVNAALQEKFRSLQEIAQCKLFEISFCGAPGGELDDQDSEIWEVAQVNPFPLVSQDDAIQAIVRLLEEEAGYDPAVRHPF